MLSSKEEEFIVFWEKERSNKSLLTRQAMPGLRLGFMLSAAILLLVYSGWYERAQMQFNTKTPAWVLIVGILLITCFCSIFYQKFKWEQQEQQYLEFIARRVKKDSTTQSQ